MSLGRGSAMIHGAAIAALLLVVTACSPILSADTSIGAEPTSTSSTTTTSEAVSTTTTSTLAATTTTTLATTTTTSKAPKPTKPTTPTTPTTLPPPTTTTTAQKTAPQLIIPRDGELWSLQYAPGSYWNPVADWYSTMPNSERERFELSSCGGCPFNVLTVYTTPPDEYPGFLEVVLNLEAVSATYRWRVVAEYADGSELASETRDYIVYAFTPITVSGTVTDSVGGTTLSGVRLVLQSGPANWSRTTAGGGVFSFVDGPGGPDPTTLTVTKTGYQTQVLPLNVGESVVLDIELVPSP